MAQILSIINPATEEVINEIPTDTTGQITDKVNQARTAQPAWAAQPLSDKIKAITKFGTLLTERADSLAATLTAETGKPITQAKNEILGTPPRIDYFIKNVGQILHPQPTYQDPWQAFPRTAPLEEIITHDPLGVIANISAWNYPYFVGSNVFIPALLTGNAVMYKPSEISTMTGLAIAALLHESGIPDTILIPVLGTV